MSAVRILLVLMITVSRVAAQSAPASPTNDSAGAKGTTETNRAILPFLDGTDVFWTLQSPDKGEDAPGGEKHFVKHKLEANISPNLVFFQDFTDTIDVTKQAKAGLKLKQTAWAISGTPGVRLRMLFEVSSPVRTPSFIPRVNVQRFRIRGINDCTEDGIVEAKKNNVVTQECPPLPENVRASLANVSDPNERRVLEAFARLKRLSLYELHSTFGHYSNGEEGCLSTLETRVGKKCEGASELTPETINLVNGSFSVPWFLKVGANYTRNKMRSGDEQDLYLEAKSELRARIDFEYHAHDEQLKPYGHLRITGGGSFAGRFKPCRRRAEGELSAGAYPDAADSVTRWSVTAQASCFPSENGGWGVFARLHTGQDYYNVQFFENTTRFQVGVTYNQTGFFRFVKPPKKPAA